MPNIWIYPKKDSKPPTNPVDGQPDKCGHCCKVQASCHYDGRTQKEGLEVHSQDDAEAIWNWDAQKILNEAVPIAWAAAWEKFKCPAKNDTDCKIKISCSKPKNKPSFVSVAVEKDPNTGLFYFLVTIVRELECIEEDITQPGNEEPQVPQYGREGEALK